MKTIQMKNIGESPLGTLVIDKKNEPSRDLTYNTGKMENSSLEPLAIKQLVTKYLPTFKLGNYEMLEQSKPVVKLCSQEDVLWEFRFWIIYDKNGNLFDRYYTGITFQGTLNRDQSLIMINWIKDNFGKDTYSFFLVPNEIKDSYYHCVFNSGEFGICTDLLKSLNQCVTGLQSSV